MHRYIGLAALLAAAVPAHAGEVAAYQAESVRLGSIRGVTYYTEAHGGYRVVTTLADGEAGLPVRFETILADRQSIRISVAGKPGELNRALEILRAADRLVVWSPHAANAEGPICVPASPK
jgi:hypothetical protein